VLRHVRDVAFRSRLALATLHFVPACQSSRERRHGLRGSKHCETLALWRHAGRCILERDAESSLHPLASSQYATRALRFYRYLVFADARLVHALSVEATNTRFLPRPDLYGVCSTLTRYSRNPLTYKWPALSQYMRFGVHAPLNADHAGIDAIEPLP